MAVSIDQRPLYEILPIGQQIIFAVSENTIVATKYKVKFIAKVHVSTQGINPNGTDTLIGTFKTTPNNEGVGIFDLRPILEAFVTPDYEGSTIGDGSSYKRQKITHPIHLIDKFAVSENNLRFFAIKFDIEYSETDTGAVLSPLDQSSSEAVTSLEYTMFNGVLQYDDVLTLSGNDYGYYLGYPDGANFFRDNSASNFLTNAPTTQYARLTDYGTLPFFNYLPSPDNKVASMIVTYYWDGGSSVEVIFQNLVNGGSDSYANAYDPLMYFGAFPGNLQNTSTIFAGAVVLGLTHYTIHAQTDTSASQHYTINIICPNERGHEGIRLTWLNQWGTWDYYTFNMKSTKSINTKRIAYTPLGGTWNESTFKIAGYKGGKKNFRVNSTENIKINTDFVTEAEGVWFEELINSNEVYILNGFSADVADTITNKYVEPVVLNTSSYVKKTIANDKLMQYTFEIEKSRMKRTQSV
tara:strand:+ start:1708 stop:3108 length:1401 start_codon:yes stop_codon:yes gene_type:complete